MKSIRDNIIHIDCPKSSALIRRKIFRYLCCEENHAAQRQGNRSSISSKEETYRNESHKRLDI